MTPTPKLRFVERPFNICTSPDGTVSYGPVVRILQQWWVIEDIETVGEWRDIPLEEET